MTFDITFFGYGAGIVMFSWILGTAVGLIIRALNTVGDR